VSRLPPDAVPSNAAEGCQIDPAIVAALYLEHADELRRFLTGVLRDADLAGDVLQAAFARLIELGHTVREGASRKSWLFSVAYHEALKIRRREASEHKAVGRIAAKYDAAAGDERADSRLVRWETVERVRAALNRLPGEQREVVRLRIVEEKKFAEIAAELKLPLGTVLSRMQLALAKLRKSLGES
jgi:RNA polymerase sigma factor (sigma-70 family)